MPNAIAKSISNRRKEAQSSSSEKQMLLDFDEAPKLPPRPEVPRVTSPVCQLAIRFSALLAEDDSAFFTNPAVELLALEFFGSRAGHARDTYDAIEAGFNLYVRQAGLDLRNSESEIAWLSNAEKRLPRQCKRDERQIELQQFSTPPTLAYVLAKVAAIEAAQSVLEPSAGTGNIALFASLAGGKVQVNEIDERRLSLLRLQGYEPTEFDAERLDNLLPDGASFDVVVMNPPFSATGGRVNGHSTAFGARHVEQGLLRLKPGGRLAAIVGRGMGLERPAMRSWWIQIAKRFNVRANVGLDGKYYGKFGTTFDQQLVVLDHTGPTKNFDDVLTGAGLSPLEAYVTLQRLAREKTGQSSGQQRVSKPVSVPAKARTNAASGFLFDNVEAPVAVPPKASIPDTVGKLDRTATAKLVDVEEGSVFAAYRVQKAVVQGSHPHPANVVESTAMACVEPPAVTYQHYLPKEVIAESRVSDLQIEDVIYAGQATSFLLPDGSRKGHWNGDGTGIGKGRELYAFIFNEFAQGRTRHVHISATHQLCTDAERDRDALGLPLPLIHQAKLKPGDAILADEGVVFSTYTMLSNDFGGGRRRFKQLTDWLGDDFDGVIAFDEAHLMKNAAATPHGGKATVDRGTLRGNMGIALQRMFPNARVRYFSATGATEARHMAPYERLGLWGPGAPFASFQSFLIAMEQGGVAAMEMLCRDLKSVGTYLSRTISYGPSRESDGSVVPISAVEYEPLLHRLSEEERSQYDSIADLWSEILLAFEGAEGNANEKRNGHRYSQFYSAQQRFFLQLMMAYTLPDLIPAIENDLASGRSIVLSLFNTGESQTERKVQQARASGIDLSELDATPREMIVQLVQNHFPIHQFIERTDPVTGNVVRVRLEDEGGNPELNRENQRRQEVLLDKIADLDFPQNPLDAIMAHFGVENVAEISGRSHRFESGKYVRRKLRGVSRRELNAHETKLFQDGEKRIAIISGAGSTGISTHADRQAKNQDRRVFYAFQLSWSADQQMQAFGRVHRSNQTSAPIVRLVLVDLAGQKRLVNSVSKRLAALGALTKGERHSLSSDLFRPEDVTDHFGKSALSRLYREVQRNEHIESGLSLSTLDRMGVLNGEKNAVRDSYASNVEQFLNRIMVLHVADQNRIFDLFYERYQHSVEAAKRQGSFDFGVEEIRATDLRQLGDPELLHTDQASGAETKLHQLEGQVKVLRNSFAMATSDAKLGFFQNRMSGRIYAVATHWNDERNDLSLTSVRGQARSIERSELASKFQEVDKLDARRWWNDEFERTPSTESRNFYVLSGAIFPIYDKVMGRTGIQTAKIARARLLDGTSLVGLRLNSQDVPQVKERLGIGTPLADASINELTELVAGGSTLELDNGWRLRRAMISGDRVIELVLSGVPANRDELRGYGLIEESIHFKRRWFVLLEDCGPVLTKLFERRKAVRNSCANDSRVQDLETNHS